MYLKLKVFINCAVISSHEWLTVFILFTFAIVILTLLKNVLSKKNWQQKNIMRIENIITTITSNLIEH